MKNKKGLSDVVTTLIIILLVLVAIGILWGVLGPTFRGGAAQIGVSTDCLEINVETISNGACTGASCKITVRRGTDNQDEVAGIRIVLSDGESSFAHDATGILVGETEEVTITPALASTPTTATVTAYFEIDGEKKLCPTPHIYEISATGNEVSI